MGFSLDEKSIKRSGANYVNGKKTIQSDENWEEFVEKNKGGKFCSVLVMVKRIHAEMDFSNLKKSSDYIVLGAESSGIQKEILRPYFENCFRVPMTNKVRSLNVSNVAAILAYEALRQQEFLDLWTVETFKGADWVFVTMNNRKGVAFVAPFLFATVSCEDSRLNG